MLPYRTPEERSAAAGSLAAHLAAGGVVAYPTETVYGLGCTLAPGGLEGLARFKGPRPFLLLVSEPGQVARLEWTESATRLAAAFWPGPLTLALDDPSGAFPPQVRGADGGVAVRVSPHPAAASILAAAEGPVTSTSANEPGRAPARDAAAAAALGERIPGLLVLDGGRLPDRAPSTIVRCGASVRLVREGAVSRQDLERVVDLG